MSKTVQNFRHHKLSIVAPAFNEEETIPYSHKRLCELASLPEFNSFDAIELIYVNDGSRDKTGLILNELIKNNEHPKIEIRVLHFTRNFGHSSAVLAGLKASTGDIVAIIDVDLQDPPELLGPMYTRIQEGFDVVYGQRLKREKETFFKKVTAWIFYRVLAFLSGVDIPRDTGDFRIMTREVCDAILTCNEQAPFLRGLVAWIGFRQSPFGYIRESRKFGYTKYPLSKMIKFAMTAILSFSTFPLKLVLYLAFIVFLLSLGLLAWAMHVYAGGHTVPGWASLMVVFLFGQSVVLFVIGVVGLYVGQMHLGVQNRPRYILKG